LSDFIFGNSADLSSPAVKAPTYTAQVPQNYTPSNNQTSTFLSLTIKSMSVPGILRNDQNGNLIGGQKLNANDIVTSSLLGGKGISLSGSAINRLIGSEDLTISLDKNVPTSIVGDSNVKGTIEDGVLKLAWDGMLPVSRGGTGMTTFGQPGQILVVNSTGSGLEYKTLTTNNTPLYSVTNNGAVISAINDGLSEGETAYWDNTAKVWKSTNLINSAVGTSTVTVTGNLNVTGTITGTVANATNAVNATNATNAVNADTVDGLHAASFLTAEVDPAFTAWDKTTGITVTESQITDLQAYLLAADVPGLEIDPLFTAWDKSTGIAITESQITDLQSYLLAEVDPAFTAWDKTTGITVTESQITDLQAYLLAGNNVSLLTNDANYVVLADNISGLTNDTGFITASTADLLTNKTGNISMWTNDSNYITALTLVELDPIFSASDAFAVTAADIANWNAKLQAGDNVSTLVNDSNYVANGNNVSLLTNDANYVALADNISGLTNDTGFITASTADLLTNKTGNISMWTNDSNYIALSSLLTGFGVGANSTITAGDSVLSALGKAQGQIDALTTHPLATVDAAGTANGLSITIPQVMTIATASAGQNGALSSLDWTRFDSALQAEVDPAFTAWDKSTGISITESQISDLQAYLTAELDPIFSASTAFAITPADIATWNSALQVETDPIYTAWDKSTGITITESQITDLQAYLLAEVDPAFTAWDKSTGISITESQISDLQAYLTAELDPIFSASTAFAITPADIATWNSALQVETDPIYTAWDKSTGITITESQITDLQAYLLAEVDPAFTAWDKSTGISITESQISDLQAYLLAEVDPLALKLANNLSDLTNAATARTNIGLGTTDAPTFAGLTLNGNLTTSGTVDGVDVSAKGLIWDAAKTKLDLLTYTAEGANGGLDADTVDGLHAATFMTAVTDNWVNTTGDTMSGALTINSNLTITGTVDGVDVSAKGLVWDTAKTKLDLLTYTAEGSGGGLDSDTVDGKHATDFLSSTGGSLAGALTTNVTNAGAGVSSGLTVTSTNTAGNGVTNMGTAMTFALENEAGVTQAAGEMNTTWTNLNPGLAKSSMIDLKTWVNGIYRDALKIDNGTLTVPGAYSTTVANPNRALYVDSTGKIGYLASSERYKNSIVDMENIDWLYALRPVNYSYNADSTGMKQYGLIAEEVDKINQLFVSYNADGSIETVNYNSFIPVLIKATQDQNTKIAGLTTVAEELGLKITDNSNSIETALNSITEQQNQIDALKAEVQNLNNTIASVSTSTPSTPATPVVTTTSSDSDIVNLTAALNSLTTQVNTISVDMTALKNAIAVNAITGDVSFANHILVNADTANKAIIAKDTTKIEVTFATPYATAPIVNATPLDFITGQYKISNVTVNGFTIETSEAQVAEASFNWTALGRN
jgi:hypothetical protein